MLHKLCFLCATLVLVGLPVHALADVLVTLEGQRLEGRLANREAILRAGSLPPMVSILVGESDAATFHRFAREDLEYVLLEVDGETFVFDGRTPVDRPLTPETTHPVSPAVPPVLVVTGIGVILVSALNPQGGPELTIDENSADFKEETYSVVNYLGFALGAALIIAGAREAHNLGNQSTGEQGGLARALRVGPKGVSVSVRF